MKKLIALTSIGLSIGFAVALANAEDNPAKGENTYESSTTTTTQQPGTADTTSQAGTMDTNTPTTSTDTTHPSHDLEAKTSKTCTDENGMTYTRGQKGFSDCVKSMSKKHPGQSGQAGTTKESTETKKETSKDTSSSGDSSS